MKGDWLLELNLLSKLPSSLALPSSSTSALIVGPFSRSLQSRRRNEHVRKEFKCHIVNAKPEECIGDCGEQRTRGRRKLLAEKTQSPKVYMRTGKKKKGVRKSQKEVRA